MKNECTSKKDLAKFLNIFAITLFVTIFVNSYSNEEMNQIEKIVSEADFELLDGNILRFKDQATFDRYANDEVMITFLNLLLN